MNKIPDHIRVSTTLQSIIVWIVVLLILFLQSLWGSWLFSITTTFITMAFLLTVFYVTRTVLIPRLFLKRKRIIYTIVSILMIFLLAHISARLELFICNYYSIEPKHELKFAYFLSRFLTFFTITYAISNIIFFSIKTVEDAKQKEELLMQKKMLEIRVLKSQINSHFIFNALNNIYSMTYFKDEYTSEYVLKLAKMMRYVMEDCETELTPLSKDIEYIENFIDFQKLRFEKDKNIVFICNKDYNPNISVPPMIFQPLVENCFKHTPLEVDKNSYIRIILDVKEHQIHFVAENSQPLLKSKPDFKRTGIGIENVRRRLNLYYKNNFTFTISDNTDSFKVELIITL